MNTERLCCAALTVFQRLQLLYFCVHIDSFHFQHHLWFYCYQYITVVHFVAKVGTLIGENRYGFAGENWYTLFYCLHIAPYA